MKYVAANGHSTVIATKVSLADKVRLSRIAQGFGMSLYELFQALLLGIVRYFDTGNTVTHESNTLLNAIGNVIFCQKDSFSPMALKERQRQHVSHAILFLQRNTGQRPQLIGAHTDSHGNMVESYNYDTMLSAFLNSIDPDALQRLKDVKKKLGYFSITHTLHEIIMKQPVAHTDTISSDVKELFSDERIPSGKKINEDVYYKRKLNKGEEYTTITPREYHRADL